MAKRFALLLIAVLVGALSALTPSLAQAPQAARPTVFTQQDYLTYFAPGDFSTHSPYYESDGRLEVKSNKVIRVSGLEFLEQSVTSLDVSRNYDLLSDYPYYKIQADGSELLKWDSALSAFVYEYSNKDFEANSSKVWISKNDRIEISADDRPSGLLHNFYNAADQKAKADVRALDDKYRKDVVGVWSMQCSYLSESKYDVECRYTHQPTRRVERYYYRKLNLVS